MPGIHFSLDGRPISCEKDRMLLDVALEHGIHIPALCHHKAQSPYGACRLCLVEVNVNGKSWLSPACTFPVRDEGMAVRTSTEEIERYRRMNLELLLARCPESEELRETASEMGVAATRFPRDGTDACISCGLCVNICRDVVGIGAISFAGRGPWRRVQTPYARPSDVCIGCGACAEVCPTGNIKVQDYDNTEREIIPFNTRHKLVPCPQCGLGYVTEKQLQWLREQLGARADLLAACPRCRSRQRALELSQLYEKSLRTS